MRFRTVISNVSLLHKIVKALHALAKTCVIRLTPDKVHFIVPGNEGREGVQVWSQVIVGTLFRDFRIESNSENEIWLEIHVEALLRVLRSCETSIPSIGESKKGELSDGEVTLKLNRRQSDNSPIWSFDIRGRVKRTFVSSLGNKLMKQSQQNNKPMTISHEVKIHLLSQRRQNEIIEPLCPPPNINVVLPSLGELRHIVSRLGQVANEVKVSANNEGTMELSVKSEPVDLTTTWSRLHIPNSTADGEASQAQQTDHMFSTTVSIKGLQKFLTSHQVGGAAVACICERHCVIFYVYIGDINDTGGVLTFFIPARNIDQDD